MSPDQSPDQLARALAWVEANPADPRTPQIRARIAEMRSATSATPPATGGANGTAADSATASEPAQRSIWKQYLDTFSDALPSTGALVGGALATPPAAAAALPTMGLSSLAIPAAGAAGYGAGEFAKRGIDKLSGRPGTPPPVDVAGSSARGAVEAMNAFSAGGVMGRVAGELKNAPTYASKLGSAPTQYAPLSDETFGALANKLPGRDIVASTPLTDAERIGARYATPRVDAARGVGVRELRDMGQQAEGDVDLFRKGVRAERAIPNVEQAMRGNVTPMAQASGKAIDTISNALPPRYSPESEADAAQAWDKYSMADKLNRGGISPRWSFNMGREPPTPPAAELQQLPPGGDVVNQAFNAPGGQNSIIRDPASMNALADVKSLGLRNRVYGKALGKAHFDLANAEGAGLTPQLAEERATDANTLGGISDSLQKQRGGVVQDKPTTGFLKTMLDKGSKAIAGPESTRLGTRAETPESAMLEGSRRQAEVEATRRGMGIPWTGDAYTPGTRPLPAVFASPNGRALTGAEAELLRQYLAGGEQR